MVQSTIGHKTIKIQDFDIWCSNENYCGLEDLRQFISITSSNFVQVSNTFSNFFCFPRCWEAILPQGTKMVLMKVAGGLGGAEQMLYIWGFSSSQAFSSLHQKFFWQIFKGKRCNTMPWCLFKWNLTPYHSKQKKST